MGKKNVPLCTAGKKIAKLQKGSKDYKSNTALATRLSVTEMTIWNWLHGRHPIPDIYMEMIEKVCTPLED